MGNYSDVKPSREETWEETQERLTDRPGYPMDNFGNCTECGGGAEGSIAHTEECKYNTEEPATTPAEENVGDFSVQDALPTDTSA